MSPASAYPHSEAVASFIQSFGLISFTTAEGHVGVSRDAMLALFGEADSYQNYPKVPKLARLQCIKDNVDWAWGQSDHESLYLEPTFHSVFIIEGAISKRQ